MPVCHEIVDYPLASNLCNIDGLSITYACLLGVSTLSEPHFGRGAMSFDSKSAYTKRVMSGQFGYGDNQLPVEH